MNILERARFAQKTFESFSAATLFQFYNFKPGYIHEITFLGQLVEVWTVDDLIGMNKTQLCSVKLEKHFLISTKFNELYEIILWWLEIFPGSELKAITVTCPLRIKHLALFIWKRVRFTATACVV